MRRIVLLASLLGLLVIVSLVAGQDQPKSIKDVMSNHKKNQLRDQIGADLKKDDPDWTAVQKKTKQYAEAVSALEKLDPPKGDKKAWSNVAGDFISTAKDLDASAKKKDAKAAQAAHQKLGAACMNCHKAHRP
jgi:hypothetical protein